MNQRVMHLPAIAGIVFAGAVLTPLVSLAVSYLYVGGLFADQNGNVGIGTTTPSEALEVVGNVKVSGTLTASNISMSFIGGDDFESYADGANIDGLQSEAGWLGPWTNVSGGGYTPMNIYLATTSGAIEGNKAIEAVFPGASTGNAAVKRELHSHTSGDIIGVKIRSDNANINAGLALTFVGDTSSWSWDIVMRPYYGDIVFETSGTTHTLQSYTANTWYTVEVQFDYDNSRARARIDGGAWSSWITSYTPQSETNELWLNMGSGSAGNTFIGWFDDVRFYHEDL